MGSSTPTNRTPLHELLLRTAQVIHDDDYEDAMWLVQRDGSVVRLEAQPDNDGYWIGEVEFAQC